MRFVPLVEHRGLEPLTPTLPVLCAPNCANAPLNFYLSILANACPFVNIFLEILIYYRSHTQSRRSEKTHKRAKTKPAILKGIAGFFLALVDEIDAVTFMYAL